MNRTAQKRVTLPLLSVHGALTLGKQLLTVAEPIEEHPAFLAEPLAKIDEALRALRGAVQFRIQLHTVAPSRHQRLRADVGVHVALDEMLGAMRSYVVRVAAIADEQEPSTEALARRLITPIVQWEMKYGEHVGSHRRARHVAAA